MSVSNIDNIAEIFLNNPNEENGLQLLKSLRYAEYHNLNLLIGQHLSKVYSHNSDIRSEIAVSAFYTSKYKLAYELYSKNLENKNLNEREFNILNFNRHFSSKFLLDDYTYYNSEIVSKIRKNTRMPIITFTITTCKRFDLFEKTMNSFLNCCKDLEKIDEWLCVDDNSSAEDRQKMKELYPFFTFYWKKIEEKGHARSMNIIKNIVKTEYIFHIEDDWKFFEQRNYISDCLEVLFSNKFIGQCLINKNYAETADDINIPGGLFNKTKSGLRYYIHEYTPDVKSQQEFNIRNNNRNSCSYWPHFSFRPSLLKREVLDTVGNYDETVSHFEMDYSKKYFELGYISAFLEGIYCVHTGRLTSQMYDKSILNAYDLNDEIQFGEKKLNSITQNKTVSRNEKTHVKINTILINLDSRHDRLEVMSKICPLKFHRFPAIDGRKLKANNQLHAIFEKNDYNMRVGMVGCSMSHIKIYVDALNNKEDDTDIFFIMEDDITFVPDFIAKLTELVQQIYTLDWDLIYLGNHLYSHHKEESCFDRNSKISLEKWNTETSLTKSMGGAFGYLINKKGMEKLLHFINRTSMTNSIDTIQQKAIDGANMNTYYCHPHMIYSECVTSDNNINSDIQYNYDSVSLKPEEISLDKYPNRLMKNGEFNVDDALVYK